MTEPHAHIKQLLTAVIASAGEAASERVGSAVKPGTGQALSSSSILRFDIAFPGNGVLTWFVANEDATGFADLLIGGSGDRNSPLTDMHLEALSNAFSEMLERGVETLNAGLASPMDGGGVDMRMENSVPQLEAGGLEQIDKLDVDGLGDLTIVQHVSGELVQTLQDEMVADNLPSQSEAPAEQAPDQPQTAHVSPEVPVAGQETAQPPQDSSSTPSQENQDISRVQASIDSQYAEASKGVQDAVDNVVSLPPKESGSSAPPVRPQGQQDLSLLRSVPLEVTVELGRTQQNVSQILDLNIGSVLELNKLAGDPMDILVNGRVLARGEVVVIDEEFGIRITEIVDAQDRLGDVG